MKRKNFLSLFLAFVMAFALAVPAFAAEPTDPGIDPHTDYLAVDEDVTRVGSRWPQPSNYPYYRVWVYNTSTSTMTVTLKHPNGTKEQKTLAAGSNKVLFESNNAQGGYYELSFINDYGNVTGIVRVRVSDTNIALSQATQLIPTVPAQPSDGENDGIQPHNEISMINYPVRRSGYWWDTPSSDYKYYKITVHNTGSIRMDVYLTHPNGKIEQKSVSAGATTVVFQSSSAVLGRYFIDFSNGTSNLTGTVEVIVSDRPIT